MTPHFLSDTTFRDDVSRGVNEYFERTGLSRHASPQMYLKTAVLMAWLALSYVALVFWANGAWQAVLLAVSLGCAMAAIGFNVQHDGGHRAYSQRGWVNRLMAFSLDALGGSSYFWRFKHNIAHHTYPNISGADDDIFIGPLGRLSPRDRHYGFHRFQHIYMWLLYGLLAVKWQLLDDFRFIASPGIASTRVPRPPAGEHALFWLGKIIFFGLAVALPLTRHGLAEVIGFFFLTGAVVGIVLSAVFQLAHCVGEADYGSPEGPRRMVPRDWWSYQVESTVNFARNDRVITWLFGGLNFQIEHHLFPRICHVHYPALSRIVEDACKRHGVRYVAYRSFWAALREHQRWLAHLGRGGGCKERLPLAA